MLEGPRCAVCTSILEDSRNQGLSVFYGTSKIDDIQIVSDIQLYLDLQGFRGRGEEAAEVLFERIGGKAW